MTLPVDAAWEAFRHTTIEVTTPDGLITVTPAPHDAHGAYLKDVTGPLYVLTAWNPHGIEASSAYNAAAGARLNVELSALAGLEVWPTTGVAADNSWREMGFTIAGLTESEAIDLAVRFEQRAIFSWVDEPGGFHLIACDGSADETRGWTTRCAE